MARPDRLIGAKRKSTQASGMEPAAKRSRAEDGIADHAADDASDSNSDLDAPQDLDSADEESHDENDLVGGKDSDEEDEEDNADEEERRAMRTISFGALVAAQDDLDNEAATASEHKDPSTDTGNSAKLQALRDRLAELRASKETRNRPDLSKSKHRRTGPDDDDSDDGNGPHERRSKHAPAEQSSRHQVTRRRTVVDTAGHIPSAGAARLHGDPRFSAAAGGVDLNRVQRNYAFLDDYAAREVDELKARLKDGMRPRKKSKSKTPQMSTAEQDELRVQIGRMENRMRAKQRSAREQEMRREHNKREREKVRGGKKPFFLKKGAAKKLVEKEMWEGMNAKDRTKAEAKRHKRQEGKELKNKPGERRSLA